MTLLMLLASACWPEGSAPTQLRYLLTWYVMHELSRAPCRTFAAHIWELNYGSN